MSKKHHDRHDEGAELHFEQVSHHGVRYENRDLGGRGIFAFLLVLAVFGISICLIVYGYFAYRAKHMAAVPPLNANAPTMPVPEPDRLLRFQKQHSLSVPLQNDDVADLQKFLARNDRALNSYGWVDQQAGVVRIPIEQAMKTIAQQGLPTRPQPQMPPSATFGNGASTVAGAAGGTRPETRQ
jgi:hypothetical protein